MGPEKQYSFINDITISRPLGLFGDVRTVSRTPLIELKANYGISALRDIVTTNGSGSVTNDRKEYRIRTGTSLGSDSLLESAESGRYMPGAEGELGIGIRIPDTFVGEEYSEWGYFDDLDGFGFGVDATGIYVFLKANGVYQRKYQPDWNGHTLEGDLSLAKGNIYQVNYCWYGYGPAEFVIHMVDDKNVQRRVVVHRISEEEKTSIDNPNLPISAFVSNGTGTNDLSIYVGGRQYAVYSPYKPNTRINSHRRVEQSLSGTTMVPAVTFRRKSDYKSIAAKVDGLDIITDVPIIYELRLNANLTGASFGDLVNTSPSETAMEGDNVATAVSGGELLYSGLGSVSGAGGNSSGQIDIKSLLVDVPALQPVTLCLGRVSGTAGVATSILRWTEEW